MEDLLTISGRLSLGCLGVCAAEASDAQRTTKQIDDRNLAAKSLNLMRQISP